MSLEARVMPVADDVVDIWRKLQSLAERPTPSAFSLRTPLLKQGRSDTPLAATDQLTLVLKVYASGGENELHAHPQEDHAFVVLQGRAAFFGPAGEQLTLMPLQGIMLPRGSLYRFHAEGEEPLVLLRVGTPANHRMPRPTRVDREGQPMHGDSKENRTVECIVDPDRHFG
jgi:mannose-6-phosphate isomerase-like protein (cupin superfamily)